MRKISIVTLALVLASLGGIASAQYRTSDDLFGCGTPNGCVIDANTTNNVWGDVPGEAVVYMDGPVMVKNGGELTILPGTTVRGQPRYAAVTNGVVRGTPGALVVTQSGEINAIGRNRQRPGGRRRYTSASDMKREPERSRHRRVENRGDGGREVRKVCEPGSDPSRKMIEEGLSQTLMRDRKGGQDPQHEVGRYGDEVNGQGGGFRIDAEVGRCGRRRS
jgi:hypothetical protein